VVRLSWGVREAEIVLFAYLGFGIRGLGFTTGYPSRVRVTRLIYRSYSGLIIQPN